MLETLRKELKNYGINFDEQTMATVLGAIVVLVVGLAAYAYFRVNQPNTAVQTQQTEQTNQEGTVGTPGAAVSLPTTHKVVAGETLWAIAEKYYSSGYNFMDIAKANSLSNPGSIEIGQMLKIPKVEPRQPLTVKKALPPQITLSQISGTEYTVVKGDYLWEIALRAYGDGYKWVDIAKANKLVNPGLIHSGNVLKLPR